MSPDAFLRRVIAQRELEQEAAILAVEPEEMASRKCRVCGVNVRLSDGLVDQLTVCTRCGGRKKQARLEREDRARARVEAAQREALRLAGIQPTEEAMANCGCGAKLRANNTKGKCYRCSAEAEGKPVPPGSAAAPKGGGSTRKNFKVVAAALGLDPDALIDTFCEGWLAKVRGSVRLDPADTYELPERGE